MKFIYRMMESPTAKVLFEIVKTYPELSMEWLIAERGEMLKGQPDEAASIEDVDYRERYYKVLEEKDVISTQLIEALKKMIH